VGAVFDIAALGMAPDFGVADGRSSRSQVFTVRSIIPDGVEVARIDLVGAPACGDLR
jgi:hypothetical protein